MGLELKRTANKTLRSKWWYGRYTFNGKRQFINLGVEVRGTPPDSLRQTGNAAFEHSRLTAKVKLDGLISEAHSHKNAEKHLEELYALKSGSSIEQIPLVDIESCWLNLPSRKRRTELWEKNQCTTLRKFREFIGERHPAVKYLSQVTPRMAQEWLRHLDELGFAAATYNDKIHLLKGFFDRIGPDAGIGRNPFSSCPTKLKTTVHHQPFTLDELNRILQHAEGVMRSIFIVGMCTAMRQGDCCQLKWDEVDLLGAFITVQTSKTGETAEIPLFPALREENERQPRTDKYVFPEAAKLYQCKNFGISWRVKQVLKAAKIKTDLEVRRPHSERHRQRLPLPAHHVDHHGAQCRGSDGARPACNRPFHRGSRAEILFPPRPRSFSKRSRDRYAEIVDARNRTGRGSIAAGVGTVGTRGPEARQNRAA
ncbi:tyrosine-type recombinase/integrase [Pontiella sulfatireligans]|uniref:Tyr recombinase domain-containing protein n=1 Tax=Pontiella sulfatireligans TaxID=2750658 RepID=A0A6C2USM4_9BACT|nr:tyrosine-type recombinase/integrase [Pontiella sulfatireligans]VGO23139.1 hypothetical protein SCARR_05244 [Pontiella sulfatireligans]